MVAVIEVNPLYLRRWHLAREKAEAAVRLVATVLIPPTPTDHLDGQVRNAPPQRR
jgi:hypothetical protein